MSVDIGFPPSLISPSLADSDLNLDLVSLNPSIPTSSLVVTGPECDGTPSSGFLDYIHPSSGEPLVRSRSLPKRELATYETCQISDDELVLLHSRGICCLEYGAPLDDATNFFEIESPAAYESKNPKAICYDRRESILAVGLEEFDRPFRKTGESWIHLFSIEDSYHGKETQGVIQSLKGHAGVVNVVDMIPTMHHTLFSASWDCSVRKWDYERETCLKVEYGHGGGFAQGLCHSQEFGVLMSSGNDREIVFWDPRSLTQFHRLKGISQGVTCVTYRVEQRQIVAGTLGGQCLTYDIRNTVFPLAVWNTIGNGFVEKIRDLVNPDFLAVAMGTSVEVFDSRGKLQFSISRKAPSVTAFRQVLEELRTQERSERIDFLLESFSGFGIEVRIGNGPVMVCWRGILH